MKRKRPPGPIPSSMLGLEVYTGAVDDFGFEDYLNGIPSLVFELFDHAFCSSIIFLVFMSRREWNILDSFPENLFLFPLQYTELKPVPCLSYSDAVKLRESSTTPI
ncbi:unnamed protein product [Arabis nemorensis]|uniref:Uncharacterized protein n=1 Tax=Arabis nemorensis TaxID=586526 RepID=A0A565C675_9BRAS|nr:unnamed protein product [Arabis nemorensis]